MVQSNDYMLTSEVECQRLERQADLHGRQRVLDHISLKPGTRFLDAGSGSGWVSRLVAAKWPDVEVVGVDLNPAYVEYAQMMADAAGLSNLRYEQGNLQSLSFADASFDFVWSQFVLYFLPDPQAALSGFARVTRPGGRIVSALHQLPGLAFPADNEVEHRIAKFTETILSGWKNQHLPDMYRKVGLTNIEVNVEVDKIYSKIGPPIDAAHRRNVEDVLSGPMQRLSATLGGAQAASQLLADWLAFLSRDDTTLITTYWVTKGTVQGRVPQV